MKAAIYCRLSEEDRNKAAPTDDSESIQNQKSMLIQYAMDRGWEIYHLYSDDDYTGADRSRPAFNQLLADAEAGRFDIVLCKTQSRFTRELELVEKYLHGLFPLWGVRFISIVDGADTQQKGNKKARQINGLINEWYLEDLSENIRSVLTSRRKNGYHIGSFAPYGYRKDPCQKGRLLVDPEAAAVVKEVFALYAQGVGKTAIARTLNDRGVPNPTEYKRQQGLRYRPPATRTGTLWSYYGISAMLTNETYIGNLVQGKYGSLSYKTKENRPLPRSEWIRVEGTHEAIIGRELWDRVQGLLGQKAKPFAGGAIGLFAKKVVCLHCGCTMRSSKSRGLYYLKCTTRSLAKDACAGAFVSVNTLEQAVLRELRGILEVYLDREELARQVEPEEASPDLGSRLCRDRKVYEKKLADYHKAVEELYLDKVRGWVTQEEYRLLMAGFRKEKERLQQLVWALEEEARGWAEKPRPRQGREALLAEALRLEQLDRQTVDSLINRILIGRRNPDTGQLPVEIHWAF